MAKDKRIYHTGGRWKTVLCVILVVLAIIVTLMLTLFFSFRKYIVYTSDGVRLEVPWLIEETVETT